MAATIYQNAHGEAQSGAYDAAAISFAHVTKIFGGVRALDDVSFEVGRGEVHCLAGENGSGKSTLIKIIAGAYQPEPGAHMRYFGESAASVTPPAARHHGVAVIWQDLALFGEMTVAENIAFETLAGGRSRLVSRAAIYRMAREALAKLGVELDLEARLNTLPIAQRQLAAIARTLVGNARVIFMDEPTASLTQTETDRLLTIVRNLSASGVAVVFVSHRLAEVLDVASRVTVLRDGKLVGVFPTKGMSQSRLTELMTGKTFGKRIAARDIQGAQPVLEVEELTRHGEFENVSFTLHKGEVLGLTGLIGAGRTELALTLFGRSAPAAGAIRLDGKPLMLRSCRDAIEAGISYVSEDRLALGLIQPQSISDNAVMAVLAKLSNAIGLISERKRQGVVSQGLSNLSVKFGAASDPVSTLSGGNQQRVVLAKWLATQPKVLILDCPTVGVDVGAREGIYQIIRELASGGLAILMISDEVTEVHFNADRILHMAGGRIAAEFNPRTAPLHALEEAVYA